MGSIVVMGMLLLLSLTIVPSSAQQAAPCWVSIASCLETAKAQNYVATAVQPCCQGISDAINNERSCFCLGKADILSQRNGEAFLNGIFGTCSITGTIGTICPDNASSTPSGTPSTPGTTPSTPSGTPSTPSTTPSTPSGTPSTPTGTPSTPATSNSIL
ncbi:hypothetical protein BVRB_6g144580 [Beta vulgaris subsp. vulgaris]|nr:hypothetical protein BVRB_6g144580 [Beta vulgaris subsp. vulgaris]